MKNEQQKITKQVKNVAGDFEKISFNQAVGTAVQISDGDTAVEEVAKEVLGRHVSLQEQALKLLWTQTVVDITSTLHEVAQMVLHDQNVAAGVRKLRGEGLLLLGGIFEKTKPREGSIPEQEGLEEVAFYAMLDTVWRQEAAARGAIPVDASAHGAIPVDASARGAIAVDSNASI
jgi:hypothetical protein